MLVDRPFQFALLVTFCTALTFVAVPATAQDNVPGACAQEVPGNCSGPAAAPVYVPPQPSLGELQQRRANAINHQAIQTNERGDTARAIALFAQALALSTDPAHARTIRVNLIAAKGELAFKDEDYSGAIEFYKKALAVTNDPSAAVQLRHNIANMYFWLWKAAKDRDDLHEALRLMEIAKSYYPEDPRFQERVESTLEEIREHESEIREQQAEEQREKEEHFAAIEAQRFTAGQQLKSQFLEALEQQRKAARKLLEQEAATTSAQSPGGAGGNTKFFGSPVGPGATSVGPIVPPGPQTTYSSAIEQARAAAANAEAAACVFTGQAGCPQGQTFEPLKLSSNSPTFQKFATNIATNKTLVADGQFMDRFNWYRSLDIESMSTSMKLGSIQQKIDSKTGDAAILSAEKATLENTANSLQKDEATAKQWMDDRAKELKITLDWPKEEAVNPK